MSDRQSPASLPESYRQILAEIKQQGMTGYALAKKSGLPTSTMHRFLYAKGSPTLATVEAVAKALELRLDVREEL